MKFWEGISRNQVYSSAGGFLLAASIVVGRWSPDRFVTETGIDVTAQPRTYFVLALIFLALNQAIDFRQGKRNAAPLPRSFLVSGLYLLSLLYMVASLVWAKDINLAIPKALDLGMIIGSLAASYEIVRYSVDDCFEKSFWNSMLGLLLVLLAAGLTSLGSQDRLAVLGGGPNVYGRLMALLAVVCLNRSLTARNPFYWSTIALIAVAMVVLSGSRGALIACSAGLLAFVAVNRRQFKRAAATVAICAALGAVVVLVTPLGRQSIDTFNERIIALSVGQMYTSSRDSLALMAIDVAGLSPIFGVGLNGYYYETGVNYPHNVFLELLSEGGAIGCALFTVPLLIHIRKLWKLNASNAVLGLNALILILVAAQFSGDLYDSRMVFYLSLFASAALPASANRQKHGSDS